MMGEASLEMSPKNNMIQDMINSDNMNSTESTIPNIFKIISQIKDVQTDTEDLLKHPLREL